MRRHHRRARRPRMKCRTRLLSILAFICLFATGCWLAGVMLSAAA